MRDTALHLAAILAVMRLGAIVLPLDWRWPHAELDRNLERRRPKAVLSDELARLTGRSNTIGVDNLDQTEPDSSPPAELDHQPYCYALTSGTTGEPKAMIVTHENMHGRFVSTWAATPLLPTDRFLTALPLAYAAGHLWSFAMLCLGATVVMHPAIMDAREVVSAVNARAIDVLMLTPNVTRALLALPVANGEMLMPNLRLFLSGTSGLAPDERAALRARVAPRLTAYYGATGIGPACVLREEEEAIAPDSVGRPVAGLTVDIVDPEFQPVVAGEIGLVRFRGPGVIGGFLTEISGDESVRDGWYYPGDLGTLDGQGFLHLRGRSADLIKRGGLMVYSQEVERALTSHPAVREAAVIGIASPDLGQDVAAFVVLDAAIAPMALIAHCRLLMAPYKVPKYMTVVESLPRNPLGKVVKSELHLRLAI